MKFLANVKSESKIRNFLIFLVDVPIFVSNDEFSENIIGEREKLSGEQKINVMAPPAPPTVSLMSIDLQREPSDLQALALVKAELLEETSQSSLMGGTSGSDTITTTDSMQGAFSQNVVQREESEKMDVVQNTMMVTHQPTLNILSNEIIEMQIKQEIARRNSQEYAMLGVENTVAMNQTTNISTETMFPQAVPSIQSEVQKSQMLMEYQTAQLSLHNTQNVLMTHDPTAIRSPENIMNTNMAPTIMVPSVHGGLETVNPILSTNVLAPDSNALLSVNVVPQAPSPSSTQTSSPMSMNQDAPPIAIHERTSPVAVKAMILNAAAEILSSPEQPSAETRSTINALIALDTEQILNGEKLDTTSISSPTTTTSHHNMVVPQSMPDTSREFNSSSNLTGSHLMDKEIR